MTTQRYGNAPSTSRLYVTKRYAGVLGEQLRQFVKQKAEHGVSCKNDVYVFEAFDRFLTERHAPPNCMRKEAVEAFCALVPGESKQNFENRASAIRRFGRYMVAEGYEAYVLPTKEELRAPGHLHRDITGCSSALGTHLRQFVEQKRGLGLKYRFEPYILSAFDRFLTEHDAKPNGLTKELVEEFCAKRSNEVRSTFALRGTVIRQLGIYMAQMGYESYILPGYHHCKSSFVPYIFSHDEMQRIFEALDRWDYSHYSPYARHVYPLLFRVLYGCGLRISEALNLKIQDVDLRNGELRLLNTKFNSERLVPMSASLYEECLRYFNAVHWGGRFEYFFPARVADTICLEAVRELLKHTLKKCDIPEQARVHDLRHTFAVHSLNRWVSEGKDIYVCLPLLSKYIGHASVEATEGYLRLTAEVFPHVARTFEQYFGGVIPEVYFEETH